MSRLWKRLVRSKPEPIIIAGMYQVPPEHYASAKAIKSLSPELWNAAGELAARVARETGQDMGMVTTRMIEAAYGHSWSADALGFIPTWAEAHAEYAKLRTLDLPLSGEDGIRANLLHIVKKLADVMVVPPRYWRGNEQNNG